MHEAVAKAGEQDSREKRAKKKEGTDAADEKWRSDVTWMSGHPEADHHSEGEPGGMASPR